MVQLQIESIKSKAANLHPAVWFDSYVKKWGGQEKKMSVNVDSRNQSWARKQKPIDRSMQFWKRSLSVYAGYKICQLRTHFLKSKEEQDKAWDDQHERAADKLHAMCTELGGFFLKFAQFLAKPDLAPDAWVRKLVVLCDASPATPFATVKVTVEQELGLPWEELFTSFDKEPIGCASVAQVHRARVKGAATDVAVKVQHPGIEELMMTDIRNLKTFAAFLQRFDLNFDLLSVIDELEGQVQYEFDFIKEANSMDKIANSLSITNRGKPPVRVPRPISGMVTRRVLTMEFIDATPILRLGDEMAKRGINPDGPVAKIAKRNILRDLTAAYGQMILRDGFFQADPHPGNILINDKGKVSLLDYGQVKELSQTLRVNFSRLVLAIAAGEPFEIARCLKESGVVTPEKTQNDVESLKTMASLMFDTKLPPGSTKATPFGEDSILAKIHVKNFPKELFFVLRTVHLLRGLSIGMGINYSCAQEWKQLAQNAISSSKEVDTVFPLERERSLYQTETGILRELVWEKRKKCRRLRFLKPSI